MNDIVENQKCNFTIKEAIYFLYLVGLAIYLTYGFVSILVGAYHIYSDGLTLSDNPALFKEGSKCVYYLIIFASHAYIIIPYINKKYNI